MPPIRNRIDMLATGIKSPVGIKVAGTEPGARSIALTASIERAVKQVPGVTSALAERLTGGRYIDVDIDRDAAAPLRPEHRRRAVGRRVGDRRREHRRDGRRTRSAFPINVRYPREMRDSLEAAAQSADRHRARRAASRLGDVASIRIVDGPPMLKSENARLSGWVYVDVRGRDLRSAVTDMQRRGGRGKYDAGGLLDLLVRAVRVSGARQRSGLKIVVPVTLLIIFVLLYLTFRSASTRRCSSW